MVNKVILIGNVGQDPEIRYTGDVNNSAKVATLRLATTERFRGRDGNLQEHTEWHSIVVWRNTADVVEKYVKKGTQLYIEGRLRSRSWDDQNKTACGLPQAVFVYHFSNCFRYFATERDISRENSELYFLAQNAFIYSS